MCVSSYRPSLRVALAATLLLLCPAASGQAAQPARGQPAAAQGPATPQLPAPPAGTAEASTPQSVPVVRNNPGRSAADPAGRAAAEQSEEEDFNAALRGILPLNPDEIMATKGRLNASQKAAAKDIGGPAKQVSRSVTISLAPGGQAQVLQAMPNNVSAITFVDQTGQPWPVAAVVNGAPNGFDVIAPVKGGSSVSISPLMSFGSGNMTVFLQDLAKPITIALEIGKGLVEQVDARVTSRGPNAKAQIIESSSVPEAGSEAMMSFLDGVPVQQAAPMTVSGVSPDDARAWRIGDMIYLRTAFTVLSPAWVARVGSADGMNVYALPSTPVVLVSAAGKMVSLKLQDR
jgi:intracellular multiplication protein IcmK